MNRSAMPDAVFLDTETLGLDPTAPIWEFACVRREVILTSGFDTYRNIDTRVELFIQHDPAKWLEDPEYPDSFKDDYRARFDPAKAIPEQDAAEIIASYVAGRAVVHGSNPGFDMERIELLLARNKMTPDWHYHPVDVPTLAQGYLAAKGTMPDPPWKSDVVSLAAGIDPADYARHTAIGDCEWTLALYDRVMGQYA